MSLKLLGRVEEVQHARAPLVGLLRPRAVAHARQEQELGARRALGEPRVLPMAGTTMTGSYPRHLSQQKRAAEAPKQPLVPGS